jgi:hypothetical protein
MEASWSSKTLVSSHGTTLHNYIENYDFCLHPDHQTVSEDSCSSRHRIADIINNIACILWQIVAIGGSLVRMYIVLCCVLHSSITLCCCCPLVCLTYWSTHCPCLLLSRCSKLKWHCIGLMHVVSHVVSESNATDEHKMNTGISK